MRPASFCLATTFYPPWSFGGDGVAVRRLAEALARRSHLVTVIHDVDAYEMGGGEPVGPVDETPGIRRVGLRSRLGRAGLVATHQIGRPTAHARRLREEIGRADVAHFHNVSLLGGPGVLRYGHGITLCTLHDYWFVCPTHILWRLDREPCTRPTCLRCTLAAGRPPQAWRATGAIDRAAARVDAFLTGSEFARRAHAERGLAGRIEVLPPFVPDDEIATGPRPPGAPSGRRPYFLVAGRLEKAKGIDDAIAAFSDVEGAELWIAGRGTDEARLRALAEGRGHVRFLGWRTGADLRSLYGGAEATIVPSLCYETFGLAALEALAQGTPALVRAGGALPELVETTGGGLVWRTPRELAGVITDLVARPERVRELGARGLEAVRRDLSERAHMERYLALVEELGERDGRPRRAATTGRTR